MDVKDLERWLDGNALRFQNLTSAVVQILRSLLTERGIEFLSISGRTKSTYDCLEKAKRKNYVDPKSQLTDISGVRIILFLESDIPKVATIIRRTFFIDKKNSLDKDEILSVDQMVYRSVHFVCDIGKKRAALEEFKSLLGLKFEIQVRTVLQHAWAELAHDRDYKFSGTLPKAIQRKLYLYAGMLEVADKGFSELAAEIEKYRRNIDRAAESGDLEIGLNSLSVDQFVQRWAERNKVPIVRTKGLDFNDLLNELTEYGVRNLSDLEKIIPNGYSDYINKHGESTSVFGIVRDWMIIHDPKRFIRLVSVKWALSDEDYRMFLDLLEKDDFNSLVEKIGFSDVPADFDEPDDFYEPQNFDDNP